MKKENIIIAKQIAQMLRDGRKPCEIQAILFTEADAQEVRQALKDELRQGLPIPMVTTYEGFERSLVMSEWKALGFKKEPVLLCDIERCVVIAEMLNDGTDWRAELGTQDVVRVVSDAFAGVRYARKNGADPVREAIRAAGGKCSKETAAKLIALYDKYDARMKREGLLTRGDLRYYADRILDERPYSARQIAADLRGITCGQYELLEKLGSHLIPVIDSSEKSFAC